MYSYKLIQTSYFSPKIASSRANVAGSAAVALISVNTQRNTRRVRPPQGLAPPLEFIGLVSKYKFVFTPHVLQSFLEAVY